MVFEAGHGSGRCRTRCVWMGNEDLTVDNRWPLQVIIQPYVKLSTKEDSNIFYETMNPLIQLQMFGPVDNSLRPLPSCPEFENHHSLTSLPSLVLGHVSNLFCLRRQIYVLCLTSSPQAYLVITHCHPGLDPRSSPPSCYPPRQSGETWASRIRAMMRVVASTAAVSKKRLRNRAYCLS